MSIARITEISSTSKKSFTDAIETGIDRASKTLRNVTGAWIQDQEVTVKKGDRILFTSYAGTETARRSLT